MATRREKDKANAKRNAAKAWASKPSLSGYESACIKLPDGVGFFKLDKVGQVKVDFMPYRVGKHNRRADEGETHFELEYEAHRVPTADGNKMVLCRDKTLGKKCAVCEWLKRNGAGADPELVQKLRTTTRHLWVVNDSPGSKSPTFKVFDSNHFNKKKGFGEQMATVINTLEDDEPDPFDPQEGCSFLLTVEEETFPGGKYNLVSRIDLKPRRTQYEEGVVDETPCLDDCLVDPGFDEVMKLLDGGDDTPHASNGKAQEPPARKGRPKDEDETDDDEPEDDDPDEDDEPEEEESEVIEVGSWVKHKKYGICQVIKIVKGKYVLEDDSGETFPNVDPSNVTLSEAPDEEEEPPSRPSGGRAGAGKKTASAKSHSDDDDDMDDEDPDVDDSDDGDEDDMDDEDDDMEDEEPEEEEPPAKAKGKAKGKR